MKFKNSKLTVFLLLIFVLPIFLVPFGSAFFAEADKNAYEQAMKIGDVIWDKDNPINNDVVESINAYFEASEEYEEIKRTIYFKAINKEQRAIVPFNYLLIPCILSGNTKAEDKILKSLIDAAIDENNNIKEIDKYAIDLTKIDYFKEKLSYITPKTLEGYIYAFNNLSFHSARISKDKIKGMKGNYIYPFDQVYPITALIGWYSPFGQPMWHNGTDFGAPCGTPIYNVSNGVVVDASAGYIDDTLGNYIFIKTTDNLIIKYLHLKDKVYFKKGDVIKMGEYIGDVSTTGYSTGCHLHLGFETEDGDVLPICDFVNCFDE